MPTTLGVGELTGAYVLDIARSRIGFVGRHTMSTRSAASSRSTRAARTCRRRPGEVQRTPHHPGASLQTGNKWRDDPLREKFLDADRPPRHHLHLDRGAAGGRVPFTRSPAT